MVQERLLSDDAFGELVPDFHLATRRATVLDAFQ
jgi:hypothetical protein